MTDKHECKPPYESCSIRCVMQLQQRFVKLVAHVNQLVNQHNELEARVEAYNEAHFELAIRVGNLEMLGRNHHPDHEPPELLPEDTI